MKRIIIFLILNLSLFASLFEEEDPTYYQQVNVITGHLHLNFQDIELKSPIPFNLMRNYTSGRVLEKDPLNFDKGQSESWLFQGGWNFLSHINLYFQIASKEMRAYVYEKNSGNFTPYAYYKKKEGCIYLKPKTKDYRVSGNLSARQNRKHSKLKFTQIKAILTLPDGSERHYSGVNPLEQLREGIWLLDLEILPSKHRILYHYTKSSRNLEKIELQNPQGTKTLACIELEKREEDLNLTTSDGKAITYQTLPMKKRTYLSKAKTHFRSNETIHYQPGRKKIKPRLAGISFEDKEQLRVEYYLPKDKKQEKKWLEKAPFEADKVKAIQYPDQESGQFISVAQFVYTPKYTEVKDNEGTITRFHHDTKKLLFIEYFDNKNNLHSKVQFEWEKDNLRGKKILSPDDQPLFSKTFTYDRKGNIIEEAWQDHTGISEPILRKFTYGKKRHLLSEEINGLTYKYEYLPHTNLITKKITTKCKNLIREFFIYNQDHLLIKTVKDDGRARDLNDLTAVTNRQIKTFDLDPKTGLCTCLTEAYLDLDTLEEKPLVKHRYIYNEKKEITQETLIYDDEEYTIYTEYNDSGKITKKTTPLAGQLHYKKYLINSSL